MGLSFSDATFCLISDFWTPGLMYFLIPQRRADMTKWAESGKIHSLTKRKVKNDWIQLTNNTIPVQHTYHDLSDCILIEIFGNERLYDRHKFSKMKLAITISLHLLVLLCIQVVTHASKEVVTTTRTIGNKLGYSDDEKKAILFQNIKDMIVGSSSDELENSRFLAEGDWEFLNEFFGIIGEVETFVNETFVFSNIDFYIGAITCDSFGISDIVTESSSSTSQQDLSLHVTGITVRCLLDYT